MIDTHTNGHGRRGLGAAFVDEVREFLAARTPQFQTASIEAAVVLTPAGPIPPGTAVPAPHDVGGLTIASRFASGPTSGGVVPYLQETSVTNAAAVVAAGAAKPESAKALALKTSPVVKVAHTLTVPDEFLDDADGLAAYLDANMGAGVLAVLDKQILTGSGAAGQIQGLLTLPGRTADVAAAAGEGMAAIATAAANVWTATRRRPDTVVVNPATYNVIWFPTGNKAAQVSPPPFDMVVVPSPDMPAGQAIVGAFKLGGMVFQRGGVATQAANTHADYFQKNQTMIRSEIRVAVVYFVPAAFCLVTGVSVSA